MKLASFRAMQWVFPVAVTLHDGEEAWFLPGWVSQHRNQLPLHPGAGLIWAGLVFVTLAALLVTVCSARSGRESWWAYVFFGFAAAMLLNVLSHMDDRASCVARYYHPPGREGTQAIRYWVRGWLWV